MKHLLATASIFAIIIAPMAFADDPVYLGEITLSSSRSGAEIALDRTGASIEVITKEDLDNASETTVAEYLANLPGISVSANGGIGANTTVRVRGLDGKYIKVLIDGIDVTDPSSTQTQFDWAGLTTSGLARIEVLKGSSSSLYGSRAIAGVINITTDQQPSEPGQSATITGEYGSFDTYRAGVNLATRGARGGLSFSLNKIKTDGFSARKGPEYTEADGYEGTQLSFSGDFQATDTLVLGLSGYTLDSEGDFDNIDTFSGDLSELDDHNTTKTRALRAYAELQTGAIQHTLSATYYKNDRVSTSNGIDTPFTGKRRRVDYTGVYVQSDMLTYTFGLDWENESFVSSTNTGSTDNRGVFGEVLYAPSTDLDLAASVRYDDHSSFGGQATGRLAAVYRLGNATIFRAVAATGFRAPSLYELNSSFYGNSALQPEESSSFEFGVEQQFGNDVFVKATAFYTEVDDLIQFVTLTSYPEPFSGQYQQVSGISVSKGLEFSGEWAFNDSASLFGNYTYTSAKDATGARLLRVPTHDLVLGVSAEFNDKFNGNLSLRRVIDRAPEYGTAMANYTVVNAEMGYKINDTAQIYMRIENLLDEDYQTSANYSAAGRGVYLGLRASF